jgi:hypothetical protein
LAGNVAANWNSELIRRLSEFFRRNSEFLPIRGARLPGLQTLWLKRRSNGQPLSREYLVPGSKSCRRHIGLRKIVALEQQRLAASAGERVGEAVAEIQARRMPGALAEITIGGARDLGLRG